MKEEESHQMQSKTLAESLNVNLNDDLEFDRFVGHIKLLQDYGCLDCSRHDLGFSKALSGDWIFFSVNYRLTNRGYEFLDVLQESKVMNKIRGMSLSMAFEVGKALLVKHLVS